MLPKHPLRKMRQTPQETSEAIAYKLIFKRKFISLKKQKDLAKCCINKQNLAHKQPSAL